MTSYNSEGKVAIRYFQPTPKMVRIGAELIYFDCQHGISMAFVRENLVPQLIAFRGGCCGQKQQVMFEATEVQYSHWKDGKGGR